MGRLATRASRVLGVGDGTAIGGRFATKVMPGFVPAVTARMSVVLVSATNGKSTAATMLAAALGGDGQPAFNSGGSNMLEGAAMALSERPRATRAVLEVDEMVLGQLAGATGAGWVVLMNASREYTRGVSLERTLEHWQQTLADPRFGSVVIANADDPSIVAVAEPLAADGRVVWVAGGLEWREDSRLCRRCGSRIDWPMGDDNRLVVRRVRVVPAVAPLVGRGRRRPRARSPAVARSQVTLPGRWLLSNLLFAVAAAATMGVPVDRAVQAATGVSDVDGRYRATDVDGRLVRLFLVKNPASWAEAVSLASDSEAPIVLVMEAFSMRDLTPGWDVDLTALGRVACGGHRAAPTRRGGDARGSRRAAHGGRVAAWTPCVRCPRARCTSSPTTPRSRTCAGCWHDRRCGSPTCTP